MGRDIDRLTPAPSACASPDGASPPALTPAAGAQTERAVVLAADWPAADGRSYGSASVAYLGATYGVVIGLDPDAVVGCGMKTAPAVYVVDCDAVEMAAWDAVEAAIGDAYDRSAA